MSLEALKLIYAYPPSVGVLLIEQGYTLLIACTRGISMTAVEGDNIVRSGAVMILVEVARTVCFSGFFSGYPI